MERLTFNSCHIFFWILLFTLFKIGRCNFFCINSLPEKFPSPIPSSPKYYFSLSKILCSCYYNIYKHFESLKHSWKSTRNANSLCTYGGNRFSQQIFTRNTNFNLCNNRRDESVPMEFRGVQRAKQIDPSTAVAAGHRRLLAKNKKYICIYAFCMRAFSNCCRPGSWHIPLTLGNCATDTREPSKPFMFIFGTSHTCHPPLRNSHTQIVPKGRINNPIFRWQPMVAGHPGRAKNLWTH